MDQWKKARAQMLIKHAFFATLMMSTKTVETRDLPTLATDMNTIWYNPDFVATLTVGQTMYAIAHETMHIALQHGLRLEGRNPKLWNIACDYAINLTLVDCGFEFIKGTLLDRQYTGMTANQIYDKLQQDQEKRRKSGQGQPGDGQPGQQPGSGAADGLKEDVLGQDIKPMSAASPDDVAKAQRSIQQRVAQAASMARMCGQLNASLERLVSDVLDPQVPWYDLLRHLMTTAAQDDESWALRDRRVHDFYLPDMYSERMGEVVIIGDTSGSIGNKELSQYTAEGASLADQLKPERIRILWADTQVAGEQVFECGEEITPEPKGGGGTDMRVPLEHAEQFKPQVVVLFTDGYTPWPDVDPDYPLIVCCTTEAPVPVGMVIRI